MRTEWQCRYLLNFVVVSRFHLEQKTDATWWILLNHRLNLIQLNKINALKKKSSQDWPQNIRIIPRPRSTRKLKCYKCSTCRSFFHPCRQSWQINTQLLVDSHFHQISRINLRNTFKALSCYQSSRWYTWLKAVFSSTVAVRLTVAAIMANSGCNHG